MNSKYLCIVIILLIPFCLRAQDTEKVSATAEQAFGQRVKILDEFIRRFNYEQVAEKDLTKNEENIEHKALLLSLFDEEYAKKATKKTINDITAFVNQITDPKKPVKLAYHDKGWYAKSTWEAQLDGKPVKLLITLVTEYEPNKSKWSISHVEADFLEEIKLVKQSLSPVTHDLDFMQIKKALKSGEGNLSGYAVENHTEQALTKFFALIESGHLTLLQAPRPTYVFTQVPDWVFELNYFERKGNNTGWRIGYLQRIVEIDKSKYNKYLGLE